MGSSVPPISILPPTALANTPAQRGEYGQNLSMVNAPKKGPQLPASPLGPTKVAVAVSAGQGVQRITGSWQATIKGD